jgi:AcrR family transcriptional regulator
MSRALLSFWYGAHMTTAPASATARARARSSLTEEIKSTARRHLAENGAAGLSLRAVARELGMVSSAVYRYFSSRDELLTALIVDAFDAVGEAAEEAVQNQPQKIGSRWLALARAIRAWALAHPHDYALIYGSPVPGYRAPTQTITPATRVTLVGLTIVSDGVASGEIDTDPTQPVPRTVHAGLARIRDELAPDVPDEVLGRTLLVWTTMFGSISYELFGHLNGVIDNYDVFFDHQMRRAAAFLIAGPANGDR